MAGHTGSGYDCNVNFSFNAENSNSIYRTNSTVQPSSLVLNYVIKY